MAVPGVTDPNVQLMLVAHCENLGSRFAVLDMPREAKKLDDIMAHRDIFDTNYAALYHPWLQVFDPLDKKNIADSAFRLHDRNLCQKRQYQRRT